MIIRYRNGQTVRGFVLSQTEHSMRLALEGVDDAVELRRFNGVWVSEGCDPVEVESAWTRTRDVPEVTIDDCVCPPEMAARLLAMLFSEEDDPELIASNRARGAALSAFHVV